MAGGHTVVVAERNERLTYGNRTVVRLAADYVCCPQCELVVPAYTGPEPVVAVSAGTMVRCGLCKWVFPPVPRLPLELRRPCPECRATILAPLQAGIMACPGCESWFFNPDLSPATRARAEHILAEQHRIAAMVEQVLDAADRRLGGATSTGPDRTGLPAASAPPATPTRSKPHVAARSPDSARPALDRAADPVPAAFSAAFTQAVQDMTGLRQRQVLTLRYGLDGKPGRTFREIGAALNRSPGRARAILDEAIRSIVATARDVPSGQGWQHRPCSVTAQLSIQALGDLRDARTPARIRAFVDRELPLVQPAVATDLLLRLSGWRDTLARHGHDRALRRQVSMATSVEKGPAGMS